MSTAAAAPPAMTGERATPTGPPAWWPALLAGALALAVSLACLPTAPGIGDSAEFTLALALGGIPHPTGYPFYVLAGHAFATAAHALGLTWVAAAAVWSAVGAAVAAVGFARWIQHARGSSAPLATLACVAVLVLHPVWMLSATVAEVYSWSHAWLAAAGAFVLGRLRRLERPQTALAVSPSGVALQWGLLCGLGAAHHATSVCFIVPLSLALVAGFVRAGRGSLAACAPALVALPIVGIGAGWLAWRAAHPAATQWPLAPSSAAVLEHLRGAAYGGYVGGFSPSPLEWARIRDTLLPWILPGLPAAALLSLGAHARPVRIGLLALLGGATLLIAALTRYGVPDPSMFFVPALMASVLALAGLMSAFEARVSRPLVWLATGALITAVALWSIPRVARERERITRADARIRAAWALIPFERGVVLWRDDHVHRLLIFQLLEGQRPGLIVESPDMLTWSARRAAFARRAGFDPLSGRAIRTREDQARIPAWVREASPLPVADFREFIERVPRTP